MPYTRNSRMPFWSIALALATIACGSEPDARGAGAASTSAMTRDSAGGLVDRPVPVRVVAVRSASAAEPVRATGTLAGEDELRLSFKVGGVVARILVDEGATVRQGQTLATLDLSEIDAQVRKATSAAEQAERDLARIRNLYRDSVATQAQLEGASTAADVARADLDAARFNRRFALIVAPRAGVVLRRLAEESELLPTGEPVLVLRAAGSGLVVRAGLADRDAVRVRVGDRATVRFDAFPDEAFAGRLTQLAAAATAGTGAYQVEITIEDRRRPLASGLIGRVEIEPSRGDVLSVVPAEAVLEGEGDTATVFVVSGDGRTARLRRIAIAHIRRGVVAVREGLSENENVVTAGAAYLRDGAAIRVTPDDARQRGATQ